MYIYNNVGLVKNQSEPPLGTLNVLEDLRVEDAVLFLPGNRVLGKVVAGPCFFLLEILTGPDYPADVESFLFLVLF